MLEMLTKSNVNRKYELTESNSDEYDFHIQ